MLALSPCEERGRPADVDPQPLRAEGNMMLNRLYAFTIVTLGTVSEALAQATPPAAPGSPAPPAPADDGSGAPPPRSILGLAIIAALVWYFMRGRSRATTAGTTGSSTTSGTATSHP